MTTTLLAYSPVYAIAGLLFLAAALCRRLERWHTRREAAVAEWQARPHSARVGTAEQDAAAIEEHDMTDTGLHARRVAALRALAQRQGTRPSRFPGETQPSGDLPDDPGLAARILNARYHTTEETTR